MCKAHTRPSLRAAWLGVVIGCAALASVPGRAQSSAWVRTGGPSGGIGYDIRMRPGNPDIMYVTDALAGVHKSTDGGNTWVSINNGIDTRVGPSNDHIPVFCLTIDPNNPDVLWVGTQDRVGVFRSTNAGASWEKRINGITERGGLTIRGIAVQQGNSNVVYIAGEINSFAWAGHEVPGKEFDRVKGVVYKSTDGGSNWRSVWRGDNLARYILLDPTNQNTVYVSTGLFDREAANSQPELNLPGGVGILKSTDAGATWTAINSGLGNLYVGTLFMAPDNPSKLLAGTGNISYRDGGGLYLTTDAGASWQYMAGQQITAVELSTTSPNLGYAMGFDEFYRTADGGQTWQAFLNREGMSWGPAGILTGFPIDLQADPRDPQRLFVNNYAGGNFLTTDGGASWSLASTGYTGAGVTDVAVSPQNPSVIYANTKAGPFRSRDAGATWVGINPVTTAVINEGARIAVDPEDGNHLLASSAHQGRLLESRDAGETWEMVANYEADIRAAFPGIGFQQGLQAIAFAPSWRLKVYGGFGFQRCVLYQIQCEQATFGLVTSDDGGHTWTRRTATGFDTSTIEAIAVHPTSQDTAWAATMGKGVFRTTDGGSTWTPAVSGLADLNVESLAVDPTRAGVIYAGTAAHGVFKSTNGGASWTSSSSGMPSGEDIRDIVVNPRQPDFVYAGSIVNGMYASTNGGASWSPINNGLRNRAIRALTVSADGSVVYAGSFGEGVYRLGQ